ncbi:hypothetical protein ACFY2R_05285 [Micromonospora olivasterospora]|uniref:Uncharacterized protein n=1 Tax=Micromonospora olivasterospora TaxID=1880 RepID=A0A562I8H7_MICOL|nr:hypothetical protein [Micromonospora olivasterospora]TWH67299.1 hypothetical protein JD77_02273 [Micromonospora olivasterospora]
MPLVVPNEQIWIDGVVLYRDDVERLYSETVGQGGGGVGKLNVQYRHQSTYLRDVPLKDVDLHSVVRLEVPFKFAVDLNAGRLYFNLPLEYQDRRRLAEFFKTLDRIPQPSRLTYLLKRPNPYSVRLSNLTRAAAREKAEKDRRHYSMLWLTAVSAVAAVVAIVVTIAVA